MKGEYLEEREKHRHPQNYNAHHSLMFPKFPPPHLHHFPPQSSFPFKPSDDDSAAAAVSPSSKKPKTTASITEDGGAGTVEVPRRPRGRPPGSKNKPKPPVVITREPDQPPMSPYILELPGSCDIVDSLTRFTRRRGIGICVLTASGTVANVTLKQLSTAAPGATVTFHGRFDILSLSAVCLVQTPAFIGDHGDQFSFTISLAGPQGQIVGGIVVGPLLSASTVYIVATSFNSPSFHRLPLDDEEEQIHPANNGGDGQSGSPVSGGGSGGVSGGGGGGGGGGQMGLYSCHMGSSSSDVMWAPNVRPPHHPPY